MADAPHECAAPELAVLNHRLGTKVEFEDLDVDCLDVILKLLEERGWCPVAQPLPRGPPGA